MADVPPLLGVGPDSSQVPRPLSLATSEVGVPTRVDAGARSGALNFPAERADSEGRALFEAVRDYLAAEHVSGRKTRGDCGIQRGFGLAARDRAARARRLPDLRRVADGNALAVLPLTRRSGARIVAARAGVRVPTAGAGR